MRLYLCHCARGPRRCWHARRAESGYTLCGRKVLADSRFNPMFSDRQIGLLVDCRACTRKLPACVRP